jgi:hypothetical protein
MIELACRVLVQKPTVSKFLGCHFRAHELLNLNLCILHQWPYQRFSEAFNKFQGTSCLPINLPTHSRLIKHRIYPIRVNNNHVSFHLWSHRSNWPSEINLVGTKDHTDIHLCETVPIDLIPWYVEHWKFQALKSIHFKEFLWCWSQNIHIFFSLQHQVCCCRPT